MATLAQLLDAAARLFGKPLFSLSGTPVTLGSLVVFGLTLAFAFFVAALAKRALLGLFHRRGHGSEGAAYALARILQYVILLGGFLLALENVGLSLSTLTALGALLAVGVGFGLQNIAQNFISGLILLIERPVQKGDVVTVDDKVGVIDEISIRSTRIVTFNGIALLVPNSKLISDIVENRSQPTSVHRTLVPVGVAYGTDTRMVEETLLAVARSNAAVLPLPPPKVFFADFGESSLDFKLAVWIDDPRSVLDVESDLRHAIAAAFKEKGIEIPFPQRDVHVRSAKGLEGLGRPAPSAEEAP